MKERIVRIQHYSSPCGEMVLGSLDDRLCLCNWVVEKHPGRVDRRLRNALEVGYETISCMDGGSLIFLFCSWERISRKAYGSSCWRFLMARRCLMLNWPCVLADRMPFVP